MVMKFSAVNFFFKESLTSLKRNTWMVVAAVGTVTVSLIIFGISLLLVANTNYITGNLESDVTIAVYLKTDVTKSNIKDLADTIKGYQEVSDVTFVSKDQALEEFKKQLGDKKDLLQALEGSNPLPDQYRVKTFKAKDVGPVAREIEVLDGVEKVNYGQGIVERLFTVTKWVRWLGYGLMTLLGLAAVFLISTTIRLTLYARRKEIEIMKFVGATDWFIRWPFMLEGMYIGLGGAIVSSIIIYFAYSSFVSYIHQSLPFMPIKSGSIFILNVMGILALMGIFIGTIGSFLSIRKYLRI